MILGQIKWTSDAKWDASTGGNRYLDTWLTPFSVAESVHCSAYLQRELTFACLFHLCPAVNSSPLGSQEENSGTECGRRHLSPRPCGLACQPLVKLSLDGLLTSDEGLSGCSHL